MARRGYADCDSTTKPRFSRNGPLCAIAWIASSFHPFRGVPCRSLIRREFPPNSRMAVRSREAVASECLTVHSPGTGSFFPALAIGDWLSSLYSCLSPFLSTPFRRPGSARPLPGKMCLSPLLCRRHGLEGGVNGYLEKNAHLPALAACPSLWRA